MKKNGKFLNSVPEGWLGCPPMSTGFVDDRFFVFKTPLKQELNTKVPHADRFSVDNIFQQLRRMNDSRIGLWIDLTNTSRYYDPKQLEGEGIKYRKFACEGHGTTPSKRVIKEFCYLVHGFFRRNSRDYVGVHCTHGFNRTGFLICSYLIKYRRYNAEEAVSEFAKFREPGIYRQMYVDELFAMSSPYQWQRPLQVTQPLWLRQKGNKGGGGHGHAHAMETEKVNDESSSSGISSSSSIAASSSTSTSSSMNESSPPGAVALPIVVESSSN